jgi:hypothetical protein
MSVESILLAQGRSAGEAARAKRQVWGEALSNIAQLPLQMQHQRQQQRRADAITLLEQARELRARGEYDLAQRKFAEAERTHQNQKQITAAMFTDDPTTPNVEAGVRKAVELGDDPAWAFELGQKFKPKPAESFTLGEGQIRYTAEGTEVARGADKTERPTAPTEASLAQAAAGGDETAAKALQLLQTQNKEKSPSNIDLALRAVNGDAKAGEALKLLKPSKSEDLTPNASLDATLKLRDRFVRETKSAATITQQLQQMRSSLDAVKKGSSPAGSQGVLVTFQKILDPTSVVRESEYARSATGLSLMGRLEGKWDQIKQGGAGVTAADLEGFVNLAEQFAQNQAEFAKQTREQIDNIAKEYGLKPENITMDMAPAARGGAPLSGLDAEWAKLPKPPPGSPAGASTPEQQQFLLKHQDYVGKWPPQPNERPAPVQAAPKKNPFR